MSETDDFDAFYNATSRRLLQAAVERLCAVTGGACVQDVPDATPTPVRPSAPGDLHLGDLDPPG